jgi:hypothetical protein
MLIYEQVNERGVFALFYSVQQLLTLSCSCARVLAVALVHLSCSHNELLLHTIIIGIFSSLAHIFTNLRGIFVRKITKVVDSKLDKNEKCLVDEALAAAKTWKENLCLTDVLATELFAAAELRLIEVKARGYGTVSDD